MVTGITLCIAAGAIWTLGGIMNSRCASLHLDIVTYLLSNMFFAMVLSGIFFVDVRAFSFQETWRIGIIILPAGLLNTGGMLALQKALLNGPHGVAFLLAQSAMVVPFLASLLFWGEPASWTKMCGAGSILIGMFLCAWQKIRGFRWEEIWKNRRYFFFSLGAFALFGSAQLLMTLPSRLHLADSANIRTFLLYAGGTLCMTAAALFHAGTGRRLSGGKVLVLCASIIALLNVCSMRVLFRAMDVLAHHDLSGIAFALAIGASMVGFTVYSLLLLKEKCCPSLLAGVIGIIAGGILISGTFS